MTDQSGQCYGFPLSADTILLYYNKKLLSEEDVKSLDTMIEKAPVAYSLGLGIPFLLSAVLIDYLKGAFGWIKKNYAVINAVSGGLLVLVGILMATGLLGRFLTMLG